MSTTKQLREAFLDDLRRFSRASGRAASDMNRRWASPFVGAPLGHPDGANIFLRAGNRIGAVVEFIEGGLFANPSVRTVDVGGNASRSLSPSDVEDADLYFGGVGASDPLFDVLMARKLDLLPAVGTEAEVAPDQTVGFVLVSGNGTRFDLVDAYAHGNEYSAFLIGGREGAFFLNLSTDRPIIDRPVTYRPQFALSYDRTEADPLFPIIGGAKAVLRRSVRPSGLTYRWQFSASSPEEYAELAEVLRGLTVEGGSAPPPPPVVSLLNQQARARQKARGVGGRVVQALAAASGPVVQPSNAVAAGPVSSVMKSVQLGLAKPFALSTVAPKPRAGPPTFRRPVRVELFVHNVPIVDAEVPLISVPSVGVGVAVDKRPGDRLWLLNQPGPHGPRTPRLIPTSGSIVLQVDGVVRRATYVVGGKETRIDGGDLSGILHTRPARGFADRVELVYLAVA